MTEAAIALAVCPACEASGEFCVQCGSTGEVIAGTADALCAHDLVPAARTGRFLREFRCTKCGHEATIDSSG